MRKERPGERVDHVVEGRINMTGMVEVKSKESRETSLSSSLQSLENYSEHSFSENLYVNGQVPRGQFTEFFSPPSSMPPKPQRTFATDSSYFSRNVTLRASVVSTTSFRGLMDSNHQQQPASLPTFQRQGSERGSLRKTKSFDDVLEERFEDTLNAVIGSPNTMGLPSSLAQRKEGDRASYFEEPEEEQSHYYNVQFARKARSSSQLQRQLTRQSLKHHETNYIDSLLLAQRTDPFSSSFLGHSLLTESGPGENSMLTEVGDREDTLENSVLENTLVENIEIAVLKDQVSRVLQSTMLKGGSAAESLDSGACSLGTERSGIGKPQHYSVTN